MSWWLQRIPQQSTCKWACRVCYSSWDALKSKFRNICVVYAAGNIDFTVTLHIICCWKYVEISWIEVHCTLYKWITLQKSPNIWFDTSAPLAVQNPNRREKSTSQYMKCSVTGEQLAVCRTSITWPWTGYEATLFASAFMVSSHFKSSS